MDNSDSPPVMPVDENADFTGEMKEITNLPVKSALVRDRFTGEIEETTKSPVKMDGGNAKFTGETEETTNLSVIKRAWKK